MNYQINTLFNAGLNVIHSGTKFDNDFSTFPTTRVILSEYTLVNLRTSYQILDYLKLFGRIENLFNTEYENILNYGTLGRSIYLGFDVNL